MDSRKPSIGNSDVVILGHGRLDIIALGFLLAILLSGCTALGPNYTQPEAAVGPNWLEIENPLVTSEPPADPKWWQTAFQDPDIDQLVKTALEQNLTLRSAGLRVLQSQQRLAIAVGTQFPQQHKQCYPLQMFFGLGHTFTHFPERHKTCYTFQTFSGLGHKFV